jgi:hypothetical protein
MFNLLKLAALVLLKSQNVTDTNSCRTFLRKQVLMLKGLAAETKTPLDDVHLRHFEFVLHCDALFEYAYRLIFDQLQTEEILFESADEGTIAELLGKAVPVNGTKSPEAIDPIVIMTLITRILSFINTIKNK